MRECTLFLLVFALVGVTLAGLPPLSDIVALCPYDLQCALYFRSRMSDALKRAVDYVNSQAATNRPLPYWPATMQTTSVAVSVASVTYEPAATIIQGQAPLSANWRLLLDVLNRYQASATNSGCGDTYLVPTYDETTGQLWCACAPGFKCSTGVETGSPASTLVEALGISTLILAALLLNGFIWAFTRATQLLRERVSGVF
jgi:hypothetical protein